MGAAESLWHAADWARAQLAEQLAATTSRAEAEVRRAESAEAELLDFRTNPLKDADIMGELAYYLVFADAIRDLRKAKLPSAPWRNHSGNTSLIPSTPSLTAWTFPSRTWRQSMGLT